MRKIILLMFFVSASSFAATKQIDCKKVNTASRKSGNQYITFFQRENTFDYVHIMPELDAHPFLVSQLNCVELGENKYFCQDSIEFIYRYLIFDTKKTKTTLSVYKADKKARIFGHAGNYICSVKTQKN